MILLLAFCLVLPACSEDRVVGNKSSDTWPDRTEMEDCVDIILMSYEQKNIEKYCEVLLEPDNSAEKWPEGYIWYNQPRDTVEYGASYDYEEDSLATLGIFDMYYSGTLNIYEGSWEKINSFKGQSCENCWESIRNYYLDMGFRDGQHYVGDFIVHFIIGPDREDQNKYIIYQASDLYEVSQFNHTKVNMGFDTEETSWGALKAMYR